MEKLPSIDKDGQSKYNPRTGNQNEERRSEMPIYVTKKGYQALLEQREKLLEVMAEKKLQLGETAKADPDLPENAEFKALRVELMFTIPKQIADIDTKLSESVIVEDENEDEIPDKVAIGTHVTLLIGDQEQVYYIGGAGESAVSDNIISYEAPLAQAVIGAREGEEREFVSPRGTNIRVKVVSINRN